MAAAAVAAVLLLLAVGWFVFSDRGSSGRAETLAGAAAVDPSGSAAASDRAGGEHEADADSPPIPPPEVAPAPPITPAPLAVAKAAPNESGTRNTDTGGSSRDVTEPDSSAGSVAPAPTDRVEDFSSLATDTTPGAGSRFAVPPAEALAVFGLVADAWRKGRFPPVLFTEIERRSAPMRATATPGVDLLAHWIEGGQALIAGDRERAREVVAEFQALDPPPEWATLLPGRFLVRHPGPPPDWQVALFWADPRNEARALVDAAAKATPNDRNLQLARAVVDHLDGDHADAASKAVELEKQMRPGKARMVVARFAGDQLLWSGDTDAAISWYKKVATTRDRTEIGAMLRTLSQEGGPELIGRACAGGFTPACDNQRPAQALRGRRARQKP
jgi:hypothetical protein